MAKIIIRTEDEEKFPKINKKIYGCFIEHLGSCVYGGIWVGEESPIPNIRGIRKDIVEALRAINIPVLRWPGGCYADTYHWKDGIGPKENRPKTVNSLWGEVIENNHFGTHEFLDLCEQLGCKPYICGNVGSGTVQEMAQWIEYLTYDGESTMAELRRMNGKEEPWKIKYWGIGNETWGCGGFMSAETYIDLFFKFSTFCRNFGESKLYKIACGPSGISTKEDLNWVETLMKKVKEHEPSGVFLRNPLIHGISLHYYNLDMFCSATEFDERSWFLTMTKSLHLDSFLTKMSEIMDKHDPERKIGLIMDEWGTWWDTEPNTPPYFLHMQNTMRDALAASLMLNILNKHCERVLMANVSETVNAIDSLILTKDEKMILTPTYHVFELYNVHQDSFLLPIEIESEDYICGKNSLPAIHGSASMDEQKRIHITLSNIDPVKSIDVNVEFSEMPIKGKDISARILRGKKMNAHNTFDSPENVKPMIFNEQEITIGEKQLNFTMPSMGVMVIELS